MQLDIDIRKTLRAGSRVFELHARFSSTSQRLVIFGPSGAGKSLTLKTVAGLLRPDAGHVRLNGSTLFDSTAGIDLPPRQRRVAYLFQDYALFPHLNVRQNIGFALRGGWRNPSARRHPPEVDYWLEAFHLQEVAHQYPHALSGGQRQRTALARSLLTSPTALLLDEPFAALDPELRIRMREELDELQRRLRIPMIIITHDPEDARIFGDEVLCLRNGRVDRAGAAHDRSPVLQAISA